MRTVLPVAQSEHAARAGLQAPPTGHRSGCKGAAAAAVCSRVSRDCALGWLQVTQHQLQQRTLACNAQHTKGRGHMNTRTPSSAHQESLTGSQSVHTQFRGCCNRHPQPAPVNSDFQNSPTCSVGPDQSDARVAVDSKLEVLVQHALLVAAVAEADVLEGQHWRWQLLTVCGGSRSKSDNTVCEDAGLPGSAQPNTRHSLSTCSLRC